MAEKNDKELAVVDELTDFRRRAANGEDIPDDELRAAIEKLRTFREATAKPIQEKKVKAAIKKTTKADVNDFFGDLLS